MINKPQPEPSILITKAKNPRKKMKTTRDRNHQYYKNARSNCYNLKNSDGDEEEGLLSRFRFKEFRNGLKKEITPYYILAMVMNRFQNKRIKFTQQTDTKRTWRTINREM